MGALFSPWDRFDVDDTGTLRLRRAVAAYSSANYFEPAALHADGIATVRIVGARNVGLWDLAADREVTGSFPTDGTSVLVVYAKGASRRAGDTYLEMEFQAEDGSRAWGVRAELQAVQLDILADFDRDGVLDSALWSDWTWGPDGRGAVLLVNSDRDGAFPSPNFRDRLDRTINGPLDIDDMTRAVVSLTGPRQVDLSGFEVRLHVSDAAASRLRVFDVTKPVPAAIIGPGASTATFAAKLGARNLAIEGLDYPDAGFSGLITLTADLIYEDDLVGSVEITLRVAPWLALPNTRPAHTVYIAEMDDGSNRPAIDDLRKVAAAARVRYVVVPPRLNRGDRWLQDEIEIGFAARPGKSIPVVLDSPRNRGLDDIAELMLLGRDFGYVTRGNDRQASTLDSFGNLDCTPPHDGPRGSFPFGRILFGGAYPGGPAGRRMMKSVSDFAYAQEVQRPIELYSDWLEVGHIDEFMSFVPAPDPLGFRLVLASPRLAIQMLQSLAEDDQGDLLLMAGRDSQITVADVLADRRLLDQNRQYQQYIDWNRNVLVREMGLSSTAIIELPALYADHGGRAGAFFPGMINLQVLNDHLAVPKPFGPETAGGCLFEAYVRDLFTPLGLTTHFVDTYDGYFVLSGEIHCGTNVVREPFETGWWTFQPQQLARPQGRRIA